MKIGIIGASGKAGNKIMNEALNRNHEVTAIVRDASKIQDTQIPVIEKNVLDVATEDLKDFDVVVNAFGAPLGEEQAHVDAGHTLIEALKGTSTRAIVLGGAGSLYVDEEKTVKLMDTPDFPEMFIPTAKGQGRNFEELQESADLNWTFVSPSAMFDPDGPKTNSYRTGQDNLLVNAKGESYLSYADMAQAIVDEIEQPQYVNQRFTVISEVE